MSTDDGKSNGLYKETQLNLVSRCNIQYKCVTMESRVLNLIPSVGFTSKKKHVHACLVFNHESGIQILKVKVSIGCQA